MRDSLIKSERSHLKHLKQQDDSEHLNGIPTIILYQKIVLKSIISGLKNSIKHHFKYLVWSLVNERLQQTCICDNSMRD